MKKIFTLTLILFSLFVGAQTEAPLNPDYLNYLEKKSAGQLTKFTSTGNALGEIPEITTSHFSSYKPVTINNVTKSFPVSYDLRTLGLVTSVKNQNPYGTCWTFASSGAIESHWLKIGFGTFDLSERNVATCNGFEWGWNNGGNRKLASAYFTRISGPILETVDPYSGLAVDTTCHNSFIPVAFESEARYLPNNMDSIKQALLDYGAIYTNYYHDDMYYNSSNKTYYCPDVLGTNHAVLLVGWDDNFVTDASSNGAWIIKNSWGASWGESGFFYISYYDANINSGSAYFISKVDYDPQAVLYKYDELGCISQTGYTTEVGYGLTKFIATGNQVITKIGTFVNTENSIIDLEVYDNKSGNTLSTLLGSITNQICTYPGHYMFDLQTGIITNNGNDFYIKVKYNTPGYTYPIPYEKVSVGYANPTIESGVCWISSSGTTWTAVGSDVTGKERDLCIRAYATPQSSSITDSEPVLINTKLFPNPFTNNSNLIISSENEQTYDISICNVTGKVIMEKIIVSNKEIQIGNDLESGIYILKIVSKNNDFKETMKFVKIE